MAEQPLIIRIPESALDEFNAVEAMDWSEGITLESMLDWVNYVAARFRPDEIGDSSRASAEFSARTFRHHQTLGCIDAPTKAGRQAVYGFRHYVQALLLRKFIWERIPSERIIDIMRARSTAELKHLLFRGIEIVSRPPDDPTEAPPSSSEIWKRIGVIPGLELHLRSDLKKPRPGDLDGLLALIESALLKNL